VLVALTPMAWGSFAVVTPSAIAIGGAIALWTGLLFADAASPRHARWLVALGWAALVLPRRDGLVWACIALVVALGQSGRTFAQWWRWLRPAQSVVIVASALAVIAWGVTSGSRVTRLVAVAPLLVVAAEAVRWSWRRTQTAVARAALIAAVSAVAVVGTAVVVARRPGGWDRELATRVVGETGNNLIEAIGVLGWLDAPPPAGALALAVAAVGVLGAASLVAGPTQMRWAGILLLVTIASSWVFELYEGNVSGTYWQGRYSLPLLVGIPLLLAASPLPAAVAARAASCAGTIALVVVNVAAWAAARRWAVGTGGSLLPWDWDTFDSPAPPALLLVALAALSAGLLATLWRGAWAIPATNHPPREDGTRERHAATTRGYEV
jgi:hypothetical protein